MQKNDEGSMKLTIRHYYYQFLANKITIPPKYPPSALHALFLI